MPRGNIDNLRMPQSTEEAREWGRKGGVASGKARREKRNTREIANAILESVVKDKDGKDVVVKYALVQKLVLRAIQEDDLNAIKYILEIAGEAPHQLDSNQMEAEIPTAIDKGIDIDAWIKKEVSGD